MIKNQEAWDRYVESNKNDPYGKACVDVAREVMIVLDEGKEFDCHTLICDADEKSSAGGITGFMAGCVAQMVTRCHSRGEEFQKKWNKDYGVEDSTGVVNPAILTISEK